jgi:putative phosphoribosyl transferase
MEDGTTYLNDELIRELEISQEYIEKEKIEQIEEIKRRYSLYQNVERRREYQFEDKTVILADDGAATGATIIATARWIKKKTPNNPKSHLIIAVPVAPKPTKELLRRESDHVEVILSPSTFNFKSVGQYYQSFEPVTDEQVINIMERNRGY